VGLYHQNSAWDYPPYVLIIIFTHMSINNFYW
jgi:hypothetical protein